MLTASEAKRTAIISKNRVEIEITQLFVMDNIQQVSLKGGTCINSIFDRCPVCATEDIRVIVREKLTKLGYRVDASTESVLWD